MRRRDTLLLLLIAMLLALLLLSFKANLSGQIASSQQLRQLIDLDDVIIAIKTTEKYHESRTNDIIETWFQLAPHNIYFVTDAEDKNLNESTGYHAVVSYCNQQHTREGLCCKMNAELELFIAHNPRWGCHFDDDNYVNMVELARLLKHFNANQDWYLGKPSTTGPVNVDAAHDKVQFWFATGGAGFCLSRSLLTKMSSYVRNGGFELLGDYLKLPDDVTLGYLIEHLLNVKLTVINSFHSHLEVLDAIDRSELHRQISFSAGSYDKLAKNVVDVPEEYPLENDPQRFRSLHCFLYRLRCRR